MDQHQKLAAIFELAQRLDIEVREATLGGDGGGLCTVQGRRMLFMDLDADHATRCDRSLRALAQLPEIDTAYVMPELRDELNALR